MVALEGRSDLAFCLYSFDVSPTPAAHLKASATTKQPYLDQQHHMRT